MRALLFLILVGLIFVGGWILLISPPSSPPAPSPSGGPRPATGPRPAPRPPVIEYRGVVADSLAEPLPGVEVRWLPPAGQSSKPAATVTGPDGKFSLALPAVPPARVELRKPGHLTMTVSVPAGEERRWRLDDGGIIRATVIDAAGPVPRVRVEIAGQRGWARSTITDEQGRFQVTAPYGPVVVTLHSSTHADRRVLDLAAKPESPTTAEMTLSSGTMLHLEVRDARGAPVAGARVRVTTDAGDEEEVVTGDDGVVEIPGLAQGKTDLLVVRAGQGETAESFSIPAGEARVERTVALPPTRPWSLAVVGKDGEPLPNAHVEIRRAGISIAQGPAATPGALEVLVPGRRYQIVVTAPGFPERRMAWRLPTAGDAKLQVTLIPGGRFTGRVVDDYDIPLAGVRLLITREKPQPDGGGSVPRLATSGSDGSFSSPPLEPGGYSIQLSDPLSGRARRNGRIEEGKDSRLGDVRLVPWYRDREEKR